MDWPDDWDLTLGEPFVAGAGGHAVRAELPDGTPVVLKVSHPQRESEHEADALERWDGNGAIRLLARDGWALLLERCEPGVPLSRLPGSDALAVLIELLPRLWLSAGPPFRPLAEEAAWWLSYLPERWEQAGRPFERRLLEAALDALDTLAPTQGEQVLVNQDLHGDNVLAARREPWLVIDPKPLAGEREFGLAPIIRSAELGHSRKAVRHRLDRLTSELGLDRERARLWTIGSTIAWTIGGPPTHVETARWLLDSAPRPAKKSPVPEVLRKGAVVRVAASDAEAARTARADAATYVDLRFADGHIERWQGTVDMAKAPLNPSLTAWGEEVLEEHAGTLRGDLAMSFSGDVRAALERAPVEIVIEWNATLEPL